MISARMLMLEAEKEQSQRGRLHPQQQLPPRSISHQFETDWQVFNPPPPTHHPVPASSSSRTASLSKNNVGNRTRTGGEGGGRSSVAISNFPQPTGDEEDKMSGRASMSRPPTVISSRRATSVKFIPAPPLTASHQNTIQRKVSSASVDNLDVKGEVECDSRKHISPRTFSKQVGSGGTTDGPTTANKPATPIINNATITPAEVVASRVLKRRLGGFTTRSYAHRTFYQPPTTIKINEAVLQNDLLSRYGGLVEECPDLLFRVVDKEIATRRSSFQMYVDACQKLNVQALEAVCTQLSTTPGRHMQRGIVIAGCPLSVETVKSLASVLRTNSETLQQVSLSNCSIGFVATASVSPDKIQRNQWKALPPLDARNAIQTTTYANNIMSPALVELLAILSEPVYNDGVTSKEGKTIHTNGEDGLSKTASLPASKLTFLNLASNNLSEADGKGLLEFAGRTAALRRLSIAQNPRISKKTRTEIEDVVKRNFREAKTVAGGAGDGDGPSLATVVLDVFSGEKQVPSPATVPSSPIINRPLSTNMGTPGPPSLLQLIEEGNGLNCATDNNTSSKRNPNFERQRQQRMSVRFAPVPTTVDTPTNSNTLAKSPIPQSISIMMSSPRMSVSSGAFPSTSNDTGTEFNITTRSNLPRDSSMFSQPPQHLSQSHDNNNFQTRKHRPTTHAETLRLTQRHVTAIGTVMLHESKRKPAHTPHSSMSPQLGGGGDVTASPSAGGTSDTDLFQSQSSVCGTTARHIQSVGSRRDFNSAFQHPNNNNSMTICNDDHDDFIPYSPWTTDESLSPGAMATRMSQGLIRGSSRQQQHKHHHNHSNTGGLSGSGDNDEFGSPTSHDDQVGRGMVTQRHVTVLPPDTAADSSLSYLPQSMLGSIAFGYIPTTSSGLHMSNTSANIFNNSSNYNSLTDFSHQQQDSIEQVNNTAEADNVSSALARFHENKPRLAPPIQREEFFAAVRSFDTLASGESGLVGLRVLKANLPFTFELFRRKFITKSFSKAANLVQVLQAVFNHHTRAQVIQALEDFSEFSPIHRIRSNEVLVNADGKSVAHLRLRPDQREDILAQFSRLDTQGTGILHPDVLCDLSIDGAVNEERQRARDVMQRMGISVIDKPSFIKLMAPYVLEKKKRAGWGPRHM